VTEDEKRAFLEYANAIVAECHKVKFEEGIPGSARYANMVEKLKDPQQFYILGYSDGREKMAKELLTVLDAISTVERKYSELVVEKLLDRVSKDKRWRRRK